MPHRAIGRNRILRGGRRSGKVAQLEVKKAPDGKILARRKDGLPLTPKDREEAKRLAQEAAPMGKAEALPPCWNCGAIVTETRDIYGQTVCVCWSCAKWA